MSLTARQDRVLLGGLAVALFVVFAKPIRCLLDPVRRAEENSALALHLPTEVDGQALSGRADAAHYRAKEQGRNCVRLFEPADA